MSEGIKLTYPTQLSGQKYLLEFNPLKLEQYLQATKSESTKENIKLLQKVIYELNRCPLSSKELINCLLVLDKEYFKLNFELREQYFLTNTTELRITEILHEFTLEMTLAYKRLVNELISESSRFFKNKKLAHAANMTFYYMTFFQLEIYQLKRPIPSYLWREINELYSYCEEEDLHSLKVSKSVEFKIYPLETIEQSYLRCVFASNIDPMRIFETNYWNLVYYLKTLLETYDFSTQEEITAGSIYLVADKKSNDKPRVYESIEQIPNDVNLKIINIEPLLNRLNQDLVKVRKKYSVEMLGFMPHTSQDNAINILENIYQANQKYTPRVHKRYPISNETDTIWSLNPIIAFLSGLENTQSVSNDLIAKFGARYEEKLLYNVRWQAVNKSEGGVCIEQTGKVFKEKVEMPVFYQINDEYGESNPHIGIARWIKTEDYSAQVGVENIDGAIELIKLNIDDNSVQILLIGPDDDDRYCLLTPKNLLVQKKNIPIKTHNKNKLAYILSIETCLGADIVRIEFNRKFSG